jgi:hypothetical protein
MKNITLSLSALILISSAAFAKKKKVVKSAAPVAVEAAVKAENVKVVEDVKPAPVAVTPAPLAVPTPATPQVAAPVMDPKEADKHMKFTVTDYDFKTLPEGPQATAEFKFKNIGTDPIELQNVQASCGCTVPEWTKESIAPGKTGTIKAIYNTQGRPGPFTKNLTVTTKAGYNKVITIKGIVEKAPATSVPTNDQNMMIKH